MTKTYQGLPRPAKRRVPLSSLTTDENLFQPRFEGLQENHVALLRDVLKHGGELDPLGVWRDPKTDRLIVADGHHRLEAYRRAKPDAKVPVEVYACALSTALEIPMVDNRKNRLSLRYDEKADWAWRLTVEGTRSKAAVASVCGISRRTVAYQRNTLKQLRKNGVKAPGTWKAAQAELRDDGRGQMKDEDREEWLRAEVARADGAFGAQLTDLFRRSPEAAAELIHRCAGSRLEPALDHIGYREMTQEEVFGSIY
ncbi:hypothetical protein [Limimaricola sp.]|uniref:hypothetical protein n=1 Tax=Limimaricola sp. TaxID=2211665 RepID=UPI004059C968